MAGSTNQTTAGSWQAGSKIATANQFNLLQNITVPNGTFNLFDVGLYEGTAAPPFQVPDYASELALCRRYFKWVGYGIQGQAEAATSMMFTYVHDAAMRATPTVTVNQTTVGVRRYATATDVALTVTGLLDASGTTLGGRWAWTFTGSVTVGERFHLQTDNTLKIIARL